MLCEFAYEMPSLEEWAERRDNAEKERPRQDGMPAKVGTQPDGEAPTHVPSVPRRA